MQMSKKTLPFIPENVQGFGGVSISKFLLTNGLIYTNIKAIIIILRRLTMKRILLITAVFVLISGQADARCAFYAKEACATPLGFKKEKDKQSGCLTPICVKSFCSNMASIGCPSNPQVKRLVIEHCVNNKDSGLEEDVLSTLRQCTLVAEIPHQDFVDANKEIVQHLQADGQNFGADGAALLEIGMKTGREGAARDIIDAIKDAQDKQFDSIEKDDDRKDRNPRRSRSPRRPRYSDRYSYGRGGY